MTDTEKPEARAETTRLIDGPFEGREVPIRDRRDRLSIEGDGIPEGYAASYRPTRVRGEHRYHGLTEILTRIPTKGAPR